MDLWMQQTDFLWNCRQSSRFFDVTPLIRGE